jgi:superfamily I DNA/RNA helicase
VALPIPVERQREVVCLAASGHQVVLGTAGSGKTTMAILRTAFLSDPEMPRHGRTLLLTYNKALCAYIRTIAAPELRHVTVEHYHKFARGYLASRGKMRWNSIARKGPREKAIETAIAEVKVNYKPHAFFSKPLNFFVAEVGWLEKHGVHSLDDYKSQDRIGRAEARLERDLRKPMWEIYESYLRHRSALGYDYDFDDLASAAIRELEVDDSLRRYKHIVVDEGQDFSPEMIRSLAKAIPQDGSITFFGDVAQQIYGHRMSWRSPV